LNNQDPDTVRVGRQPRGGRGRRLREAKSPRRRHRDGWPIPRWSKNELLDDAQRASSELSATGKNGKSAELIHEWNSALRGETIFTEVEVDPVTGEVSWQSLADELPAMPL
jgi:hypothetical protein